MKVSLFFLVASSVAGLTLIQRSKNTNADPGLMSDVVEALQEMMDQSQKDGEQERRDFAGFKCQCDSNAETYAATIDAAIATIEKSKNIIAKKKASNGELSLQCQKHQQDIQETEARQKSTNARCTKAQQKYDAFKLDSDGAIIQMKNAIDRLSEVDADQTAATGADHTQFMAGHKSKAGLLKMQSLVKEALVAAESLETMGSPMPKSQELESFLQASGPGQFTGTYTSQSAKVMGIIQDMRDTFIRELKAATAKNIKEQAACKKLLFELQEDHDEYTGLYNRKQKTMGENDEALDAAIEARDGAIKTRDSTIIVRDASKADCDQRTSDYEKRKVLRDEEEAAIAEAISILDSDAAFATFSGVKESRPVTLLQLSSDTVVEASLRRRAEDLLQQAAGSNSSRFDHLLLSLATHPFGPVLQEIDNMIKLIDTEQTTDKKQLDYCNDKNAKNTIAKGQKQSSIQGSKDKIETLTNDMKNAQDNIDAYETQIAGLNKQEAEANKERKEENAAHNTRINHLKTSIELIRKAQAALEKYYGEKGGIQQGKDVPNSVKDGLQTSYEGQSKGGNKVINLLVTISGDQEKERNDAIEDEKNAVTAHQKLIKSVTDLRDTAQFNLEREQGIKATKQAEREQTRKKQKETEAELAAIEAEMAAMKPGCDFMIDNFDKRTQQRADEKTALQNAITLLKDTPIYKTGVAEEHNASLGECLDECGDEAHAKCKACLAGVTVQGYCAGHQGTPGC